MVTDLKYLCSILHERLGKEELSNSKSSGKNFRDLEFEDNIMSDPLYDLR